MHEALFGPLQQEWQVTDEVPTAQASGGLRC